MNRENLLVLAPINAPSNQFPVTQIAPRRIDLL